MPKVPPRDRELFVQAKVPVQGRMLSNFDDYETTDTDKNVFRLALPTREDKEQPVAETPDGFYIVTYLQRPCPLIQLRSWIPSAGSAVSR